MSADTPNDRDELRNLHQLQVVQVRQVGIRERPLLEALQDATTPTSESASRENEVGNLTCRLTMTEEDDSFAGDEGVEEEDNRVGVRTVGVEVRVEGTGCRRCGGGGRGGEGLDELDEGVLEGWREVSGLVLCSIETTYVADLVRERRQRYPNRQRDPSVGDLRIEPVSIFWPS